MGDFLAHYLTLPNGKYNKNMSDHKYMPSQRTKNKVLRGCGTFIIAQLFMLPDFIEVKLVVRK